MEVILKSVSFTIWQWAVNFANLEKSRKIYCQNYYIETMIIYYS